MNGLIKLIIFAALAYGAYIGYDKYFGGGLIEGTWRSDKEATLAEAEKAGMGEGRRVLLGRMLGKMVVEIEDGSAKSTMDGQSWSGTYERVEGSPNCFAFSYPTLNSETEACLRDGKMYVYSDILGFHEVFERL
ncbi:MAG: hypothetical protein AAF351_07260 [Pseudomonadota bacterium]